MILNMYPSKTSKVVSNAFGSTRRGALTLVSTSKRCSSSTLISSSPSSSSSQTNATTPPRTQSYTKPSFQFGLPATLGIATLTATIGYTVGLVQNNSNSNNNNDTTTKTQPERVLPNGYPRGCCSCEEPHNKSLSPEQQNLPSKLSKIVGSENILSGLQEDSTNTIYLKGARLGRDGKALAIVTPTTLQQAVDSLQAIVDADCVVVPQGANTGLTGGSVPRPDDESTTTDSNNDTSTRRHIRPSVIISMKKLNTMFPIDNGTKVVCLAGSGIATLAKSIPEWGFTNRESHSILGSTFLNPTTAAGVAFGSGGTQLRKGPAYTDRALYAKVYKDKWNKNVVKIVNTLGIEGIEDDDFVNQSGTVVEQLDIYTRDVQTGYQRPMAKSSNSVNGKAMASDTTYASNICKHDGKDGNSVSRYNADTKGLECNRSEGKVLILATVHDTFPKPIQSKTYFISTQDIETALALRKQVCLNNPNDLPVSVEYIDRDAFDVIDRSGRIMANIIKVFGMGSLIGYLWNIKLKVAALPFDGAEEFCDKLLHYLNNFTPAILPAKFMDAGKKYDHHIAITVGEYGSGELQRFQERLSQFQKSHQRPILVQECTSQSEENSLVAFRFVAAPAFRTWCIGENVQGISVDYALPKGDGQAPPLKDDNDPTKSTYIPVKRMRYSHFGCNVVHEDIAYPLGVDTHAAKMEFKHQVEKVNGRLPAEHGHGTEYHAPDETQKRWKKMDPNNVMNPGIGGLSVNPNYK